MADLSLAQASPPPNQQEADAHDQGSMADLSSLTIDGEQEFRRTGSESDHSGGSRKPYRPPRNPCIFRETKFQDRKFPDRTLQEGK